MSCQAIVPRPSVNQAPRSSPFEDEEAGSQRNLQLAYGARLPYVNRPPQKTFRSTYGARSYPNRHLNRLVFIQP